MNKRLIFKIILACVFFLGLLPILLSLRGNATFQAVLFVVSIALYGIAELVSANKATDKRVRIRLCHLSSFLFMATLFVLLAFLVKTWFTGDWTAQIQIGFLMLATTYYSIALMHLLFLKSGKKAQHS